MRISRINHAIVATIFIFLMLLCGPVAFAGGDCDGDNAINCSPSIVGTGGDATNSISDSGDTLALGLGGSDMDIRDGLVTYSYLFGLVQGSKPNLVMFAEQRRLGGDYETYATTMCGFLSVRRAVTGKFWFRGRKKCVSILTVPLVDPAPAEEPAAAKMYLEEHEDDEYEYHAEQLELYESLAQTVAKLQEEVSKPPPKPVTRVQRVVEQKPLLTDEQRQALLEVVK